MGARIRALAVVITVIVIVAGGLWVYNALPKAPTGKAATMVIDFTAWDELAGAQDAATSAVDIYRLVDGNYVSQETVTMDAAAKASTLVYTTGETLYLKAYDASDTSVCTQYLKFLVPFADESEIYGQAFQVALAFVDKGDTAKDILIKDHNNTAYADTATMDVTNNSWDSSYAELDIELRAFDDDSGYTNTNNFLLGYGNYHYIVMTASGTGWDSVNLLTSGWQVLDKASTRYFVYKVSDTELTRDLQSTGEYDPDGTLIKSLVFDFTGFAGGDSVTFAYEYRWYSCWEHFKDSSAWGTDTAATSESVTIQY